MSFEVSKTTYDPKDRKSNGGDFEPLPEGKYMCTIKNLKRKKEDHITKSWSIEGANHCADLLEATYVVHEENPSGFKGRHIWSSGIWIFKDEKHIKSLGHGKNVLPNPGGNERYAKFLEVAGYKLEKETVELEDSDGKTQKRDVVVLPIDIDFEQCEGKPVIIDLKNKEGKDGKVWQNERGVFIWEKEDEDLPF